MDLLGGYGSDDSESTSSENAKEGSKTRKTTDNKKSANMPQASVSRKGKKLVSISSVLPAHILEQLQKGGTAYDSEDEDDEGIRGASRKTPPPTNESKRHYPADQGVASLLAELSKSAPLSKKPTATKPLNSSTPMGFSFMQTTTEVIRQKSAEQVLVETVHSDSSSSDNEDSPTVSVAPIKHPPREPSSVESDLPKPIASYGGRGRVAAPTVSVPRPSAPRPVVRAPAAVARPPQPTRQQYQEAPSQNNSNNARERKRSRQQMERALREGNLDAIADSEFDHLQQQAPDSYALPQEQHHQHQGHGIKVAPVAMYDTKQGQGVVGAASGKARGKNQINYLMASAAAYEADQQVVTSAQKMKIYRANAKQKYGW